jgi:hypothetical protein
MTDVQKLTKAADALRGFTVKDDEGWGWPLNKQEREEAARRVLAAIQD